MPLGKLLAPFEKAVVDASGFKNASRFARAMTDVRNGTVDPIEVTPGDRGIPIPLVKLKTGGGSE
jgi:hypothetical protein